MKENLLERLETLIRNGLSVEEAFEIISWREFEDTVAEIFEVHGFNVKRNIYIKNSRRYQIDFIAEKSNKVIVVDCKQWSKHRYKISELKKACLRHREKSLVFMTSNNVKEVIPLIITLLDENFYEYEGVFVIPLFKLNYFLLSL
ncbi:MAG: restriction endonuclease [Candidatus Aenigmatarchaeota archaeon]